MPLPLINSVRAPVGICVCCVVLSKLIVSDFSLFSIWRFSNLIKLNLNFANNYIIAKWVTIFLSMALFSICANLTQYENQKKKNKRKKCGGKNISNCFFLSFVIFSIMIHFFFRISCFVKFVLVWKRMGKHIYYRLGS